MPTQFKRRLSTRARALGKTVRKEQEAYLRDVGRFVRDQARKNVAKRSRETERSIKVTAVQTTGKTLFVEVGSPLPRARWLEEGTGLYGPRKTRIVPKSAKALAWQSTARQMYGVAGGKIGPSPLNVGVRQVASGIGFRKGKTTKQRGRNLNMMFARSVRGIKPTRFLERAFKGTETGTYRKERGVEMMARIRAATEAAK